MNQDVLNLPDTDAAPVWLPDLAEALAGRRDDRSTATVAVPMDRLESVRQQARTNRVDDPQQRWLRWFLVERLQTPGSRPNGNPGR